MGIRCTQFIGLNSWASDFVKGESVLAYTERGSRVYSDGREEPFEHPVHASSVKREDTEKCWYGMFEGEETPLAKYTFPDGRVYFEDVQAEPWSSGPLIFLALKDDKGNWIPESLWSDEEVQAA